MEKIPQKVLQRGLSFFEENFMQSVGSRFPLWEEVVRNSNLSQEGKEEVIQVLVKFRDDALISWERLDDAFYNTINRLLIITDKETDQKEAKAVFENIRDDIWDFFRELKEKE